MRKSVMDGGGCGRFGTLKRLAAPRSLRSPASARRSPAEVDRAEGREARALPRAARRKDARQGVAHVVHRRQGRARPSVSVHGAGAGLPRPRLAVPRRARGRVRTSGRLGPARADHDPRADRPGHLLRRPTPTRTPTPSATPSPTRHGDADPHAEPDAPAPARPHGDADPLAQPDVRRRSPRRPRPDARSGRHVARDGRPAVLACRLRPHAAAPRRLGRQEASSTSSTRPRPRR